MKALTLSPNVSSPDELYQMLTDLHTGRTAAESERINARLILILINQIGDDMVIREALRLAGQTTAPAESSGLDPEPALR